MRCIVYFSGIKWERLKRSIELEPFCCLVQCTRPFSRWINKLTFSQNISTGNISRFVYPSSPSFDLIQSHSPAVIMGLLGYSNFFVIIVSAIFRMGSVRFYFWLILFHLLSFHRWVSSLLIISKSWLFPHITQITLELSEFSIPIKKLFVDKRRVGAIGSLSTCPQYYR